ncbi:MAG TPA: hypothetical protein VI756_03350, partial [Blastocatellia bacterium]
GPPGQQPLPRGGPSGKWIAGVIAFLLFGALVAAAYIVIRGPGRSGNLTDSAQVVTKPSLIMSPSPADDGSFLATTGITPQPSPAFTLEPSPTPTLDPLLTATEPTPGPRATVSPTAQAKNSPKPEPSKAEEIIDDQSKPGRKTKDSSDLSVAPTPVPRPSPKPTPTQDVARQDFPGSNACLVVTVTDSGGHAMPRFTITCSEFTGTGHPNSYGGRTDGGGRWRQCGMTPGHKVTVQIYDMLGSLRAGRQATLISGQTTIEIHVMD